MPLLHNRRSIPQTKTFEDIRNCLSETNKAGKEEYASKLRKLKGELAQFRLSLFLYPTTLFVIVILITLAFLVITLIIKSFAELLWVRVFFCFLCVLYLLTPLILLWITPKFEMDFDTRWSKVLNSYQKKIGLSDSQAKYNLKRAILYYTRQCQPLKFFVNLMWGGIFIGCLPDLKFQQAIISFLAEVSFLKLFSANPFGAACLVSLPFIYTYYFVRYEIPVIWMEHVITQIELGELRTSSIKYPPYWETATPQERASRWRHWVQSHRGGPSLPDEALRRENMYD